MAPWMHGAQICLWVWVSHSCKELRLSLALHSMVAIIFPEDTGNEQQGSLYFRSETFNRLFGKGVYIIIANYPSVFLAVLVILSIVSPSM